MKASKNPADIVLRSRLREVLHFPDLTERLAIKLSAVPFYTARSHFALWIKKVGGANFEDHRGVFTPLVAVEIEATDARVDPRLPIHVRGETYLGKTVDASGNVSRILREGRHEVQSPSGERLGWARYVNVFTRYDLDPQKRRVTALPPNLGLGDAPTRLLTMPEASALVPLGRVPDHAEDGARVWHYGQTDANRHVNSMEYLRMFEQYAADVLVGRGIDMTRAWFAKAQIVYRKPCFRGEGYRRALWIVGENPLTLAGVFRKVDDPADGPPATAVTLTVGLHAPTT